LDKLPDLIFLIFFIIAGVILIVGTNKKWMWLVDPPEDYWMFYSHSFIKKIFGKKMLLYFNYFLGILFILFSLIGIGSLLK
jgi:hypothetical protein